jgi:hypothetical protein
MSVLGYLAAALNLIFAIGLILAMVLHITEQETSGGGGWASSADATYFRPNLEWQHSLTA